jgi:chemotaxis protein MotB
MARRDEPEEEGSGYSWMDTYGDMVTLLLCFFVLLYSMSSMNATKAAELVSVFSGSAAASAIQAFDITKAREQPISTIDEMINYESRGAEGAESMNDPALLEKQEKVNETFDELFMIIKTYIETNDLSGKMSVERTDDVIILRFSEMALFDSGKATILPDSLPTLDHFIQIISENIDSISNVNIEGHTDNVPISTAEFKDNWDLSAKRATNTLRILIDTGLIDETKLSAIGYGEFQPIAPNDTAEGRAINRRVDFVLNKYKVTDGEG